MFRIAALLGLASVSSAAAQTFAVPSGCSAYLTIQGRSCSVSHYFTCDTDAEGEQRRVSLDEQGLTYVGKINRDAEWVEGFHVLSGHSERLARSDDPMSIRELFSENLDTWDFETESAEIGGRNYVGFDRLTGAEVEIDGVRLLRTEFELTAYDENGSVEWQTTGAEFASPEWSMFIGGLSTTTIGASVYEDDNTPVEFLFPDEQGFLSTNPKYGCGLQLSSLEVIQ